MTIVSDQAGLESHGSVFQSATKQVLFGAIAGAIGEMFDYPFDLAKVRLQAQLLTPPSGDRFLFKGPLDCLIRTWQGEGFRGLYRGLPLPLIGSMVDTGVLFVSYSAFQNVIRNFTHPGYDPSSPPSLSLSQLSLAAASAGLAHSFILTPVELVKCKMQVQMLNSDYAPAHSSLTKPHTPTTIMTSIRKMSTFPASNTRKHPATIIGGSTIPLVVPPGPVAIVRNTLQTHGFTGLYLGHTGTMLRETGGTAVWFAVKEYTAQLLQEHRLGAAFNREAVSESTLLPWESAASGALAGAVCVVALYPVDTVKNAMQTQEELSSKRSKPLIHDSFWRTTTRMYHQHGMRGLYAGCGMTVARTVPSSGLVFLVYDVLSASFGA